MDPAKQLETGPLDLLGPLAFNAPLRTGREDAQKLRSTHQGFFEQFGPKARLILDELMEKYAEHGDPQFVLPGVLKVPPISYHGQIRDIVRIFGVEQKFKNTQFSFSRF